MRYTNKGEYNPSTLYKKGDVVIFDGVAYWRTKDGKGVSPKAKARFAVWKRLNQETSEALAAGGMGGSADLPFGTEVSYTEILPRESVEIAAREGTSSLYADLTGLVHTEVGKKYRVIFDGVEYVCEAFEYSAWGAVCVGNGALIGATIENNEPFCINRYASYAANINVKTEGTHTVSIEEIVEEVSPLPNEYLTGAKPTPYQQLVTDGDGKAVWEERLAYKEIEKTELLSETVFSFEDFSGAAIIYSSNFPKPTLLKDASTISGIVAYWDGVEYSVSVWKGNNSGETAYCAGNPSYGCQGGEDDGTPFLFMFDLDSDWTYTTITVYVAVGGGTHTAAIYEVSESTKTIDPEYLPEGIGYKEAGQTFLDLNDYTLVALRNNTFEDYAFSWLEEGKNYNVQITTPSGETKDFNPQCALSSSGEMLSFECKYDDEYEYVLFFKYYPDSGISVIMDSGEGGVFSIIVAGEETIHPIPAEYLPTTPVIISPVYVTDSVEETGEYTCSHTFEEIKALYESNGFVNAVYKYKIEGSYNIITEWCVNLRWISAAMADGVIAAFNLQGRTLNDEQSIEIVYNYDGSMTVTLV